MYIHSIGVLHIQYFTYRYSNFLFVYDSWTQGGIASMSINPLTHRAHTQSSNDVAVHEKRAFFDLSTTYEYKQVSMSVS